MQPIELIVFCGCCVVTILGAKETFHGGVIFDVVLNDDDMFFVKFVRLPPQPRSGEDYIYVGYLTVTAVEMVVGVRHV